MIKWDDHLWLFTVDEYNQLPDSTKLYSIGGVAVIKGVDVIDLDTRAGHIAFGIKDLPNHPLSELFTTFKLAMQVRDVS